ncbi:MAG: hypothetical protein E6Q34_03200 [Burkholderiaceae bacterium]|nr:MAG: hypothetical protein E6Q34_03200 [Burkholderiaceae bacterium]
MSKDRSFVDQIAANSGEDPEVVTRVIEEFCLGLRRALDEYKGINGDYIGEQLHWDISNRAFFHLLGFLDQFSEKYQWEPGSAREYILRLFTEDDWKPFSQEYVRANSPENQHPAYPESGVLDRFCSTAYACAMSLMSNADYVQKELPNVELPTDIRASIESLCLDWIGTKHDVVHELAELKDSANIEDRVRRIMAWLGEDMVKLQEQVRKLEALASSDERFKLAYLLVGESGGNILRSFVAAGESADQVLEDR